MPTDTPPESTSPTADDRPEDTTSDDVAAQRARLVERFDATLPNQSELAESLLERYSEPQRKYHTVDHLEFVLDRIDEFKVASNDLFIVRLGAWFHDAVYDLPERELTNEEASARLTVRSLILAGLDQEDINEVTRMVRLTANHRPPPGDPNGSLLCDADLAILGSSPEDYAAYVAKVREEYAHVSPRDFVRGRLEILEPMLDTEIFRTTKGRKLSAAAQDNLIAEFESLELELETLEGHR